MKKFEFDLEKLLSYKEQMLDSEMMVLANLNSELEDLQNQKKHLENQQLACKIGFEENIKKNTTPQACQMYSVYAEDLKEKLDKIEKAIEEMLEKISNQIEVIKELKLETKSLETLKSSRFEEYKKEELKSSEQQLEEFVSTAKIISKSN